MPNTEQQVHFITFAQLTVQDEHTTQVSSITASLESFTGVILYMNCEYEGLEFLGAPKENIPEKGAKIKEGGAEECSK